MNEEKTLYYEINIHKSYMQRRFFIANNTDVDINTYVENKFDVKNDEYTVKYLGDNVKTFSNNALAEPIQLSRTEIYKYTNDKEAFYDMVMSKINLPSLVILDSKYIKQAS